MTDPSENTPLPAYLTSRAIRPMKLERGPMKAKPAPRRLRARTPKTTRQGNIWILMTMTLIGAFAGVFALPTFMVLACGLPPALVAALVDDQPGRHASSCVLAANLSGIAPILMALWTGGNTIGLATMLLSDVYVWLGMYGAAALGWVLIWLWPLVIEFTLAFAANQRIRKLRVYQERLMEEWGDALGGETQTP